MKEITAENTALILIGYQNDYFADGGILHENIEYPEGVLKKTLKMLDVLVNTDMLIITTPIIFTPDYSELNDPVGILKIIKNVGAFKHGSPGAETIPEIRKYGDRIIEIPGKIGLNAFVGTHLDDVLQSRGIENIILAGAVTSVCIDSTGRSAYERQYQVVQLSDCTSGRTKVEQDFYCNVVFPIYAKVMTSKELLQMLGLKKNGGKSK